MQILTEGDKGYVYNGRFTGPVQLEMIIEAAAEPLADVPNLGAVDVARIHHEDGAVTHWHTHPGGQILAPLVQADDEVLFATELGDQGIGETGSAEPAADGLGGHGLRKMQPDLRTAAEIETQHQPLERDGANAQCGQSRREEQRRAPPGHEGNRTKFRRGNWGHGWIGHDQIQSLLGLRRP